MMFSFVEHETSAKIKVVGVGGAGGNAINNMIDARLQGCKFIAVNTDAQDLDAAAGGAGRGAQKHAKK